MEKRKRYLLTVLWLAGMLLSVRGLLASDISLLAAILVGAAVSGARLASGSVLSGKTMWPGVCVLLLAVVKTFLYYSVPDRKPGRYNVGSTVLALVILAGIFGLTGGYQRMAALENWKQGVKDGVEEFRYGRDTLPKGNLSKAAGLQHGEEERLQIHMDTPQELYPRGFVGGTYTGTSWEPVDASAYQGEYEGMLQWLETENFSPLSQYDRYEELTYEELTRNNQEQSLTRTEVTVKNTGAYRKYMYLPTTVSEWRMQGKKRKTGR